MAKRNQRDSVRDRNPHRAMLAAGGTSRRQFLTRSGAVLAGCAAANIAGDPARARQSPLPAGETPGLGGRPPNLVVILADDLGYGEVGAFGQRLIQTPRIDELADQGMRFTDFYAGGPVCAPSRCAMLTGLHTGHCTVRENPGGDVARATLSATDVTFAEVLRETGYRTGCFGKWGFGPEEAGQSSHPNQRGFDEFFGYITHRHAHDYYPDYLWRDGDRIDYPENGDGRNVSYGPQLCLQRSLDFLDRHRDQPFLLFFSPTLPHAPHDVPSLGEYEDKPWEEGAKGHAAQITLLDNYVGQIVDRLTGSALAENTLVLVTGDNGAHEEGGRGHDPRFFTASGPLRGVKRNVYEGGIRVPMVAWSPGLVQPRPEAAAQSWTVWDLFPTFAELAGAPVPPDLDGASLVPALTGGAPARPEAASLYWFRRDRGRPPIANATDGGRARDIAEAVRRGDWKAVRFAPGRDRYVPDEQWSVELYNLRRDISESTDVAAAHPDLVTDLVRQMRESWRQPWTPRPYWSPGGLALAPPEFLVAGEEREVSTSFTNHGGEPATSVRMLLTAPAGWSVRALTPPAFQAVPPGGSVRTRWTVTPAADAEPAPDRHLLDGAVTWQRPTGPAADRLAAAVNLVPAPPVTDAFLSDLTWVRAVNGYGPVERDRSNGSDGTGDGDPISLAGQEYEKGLGVHAEATVAYYLGGVCSRFTSTVGIDDYSARRSDAGSVTCYVFGDGKQLYASGVLTSRTGPRQVDLPIAGVDLLELVVTNAENTAFDHASWADAKVHR